MKRESVLLICPTFNPGERWSEWIEAVKLQNAEVENVLVLDSGSVDGSVLKTQNAGFKLVEIPNSEFNHGATRNLGATFYEGAYEFIVFLTQDAILASEGSLSNILRPFQDPLVGAVCGRQLPHKNARPLEAHARLFNYPTVSKTKCKDDISILGIKAAFMSNSFAAYRYSAFMEVGGFPQDTIFAEDMSLAAKMILKGYKVAYCAEACVYHSHSYSIKEEFKRYFDVGVFYEREKWISENFGKASGEGVRFVVSELKYLLKGRKIHLLPDAFIRTVAKFIAFKVGRLERFFPFWIKERISMNRKYWVHPVTNQRSEYEQTKRTE